VVPEVDFACNMDAFSAEQRARHADLGRRLFRTGPVEVAELRNGYSIELRGGSEAMVEAAQWAALESLCCPFFDFSVGYSSARGRVTLAITGPDGVKAFMQEEFGALLKPA
jgi:hypothetical protein